MTFDQYLTSYYVMSSEVGLRFNYVYQNKQTNKQKPNIKPQQFGASPLQQLILVGHIYFSGWNTVHHGY